ncbi:MAG: nitroreductase/quinone reductase family protein [Actinomycetota bacterium]
MTAHTRPPLPRPVMRLINTRLYRNVHRWLFSRSGGRLGARINRMDTLLLTTTGRRSGRAHTVPLLSLPDGDALVVVASNGGSGSHPSWWHNLSAHPEVSVTTRDGTRPMRGRPASPEERARMWPRLAETNELYGYYPRVTQRAIPLVYLEPEQ